MEQLLKGKNRSWLMGFSTIWIIGLHFYMYSAFPENSIWGLVLSKGYIGVDVFLFLSAYGLCYSLTSNSIAAYYKHRAKRLFPLYLIFLTITLVFFGKNYSEPSWLLFIFQSTGLASFRQTDFEWFIPALIVLYAIFPLLFKGIKYVYEKFKWGILVLVIVLSLMAPMISRFVFPLFAKRLPIIVIGTATYFAVVNKDKRFLILLYFVCAAMALILRFESVVGWSLLLPSVLFLLGESCVELPFCGFFSYVGKHSLEVYLAQSLSLNHFFLNSELPYLVKCVLALVILVGSAAVFGLINKYSSKVETRISHNRT